MIYTRRPVPAGKPAGQGGTGNAGKECSAFMGHRRTGNLTGTMDRQTLIDTIGWGLALWLIGYILGIFLFFVLPAAVIGWAILPAGVIVTLYVLLARIAGHDLRYHALLAAAWTALAIACDYVFIVLLLRPAEPYYKTDVYVYYLLMVALPLLACWWKARGTRES